MLGTLTVLGCILAVLQADLHDTDFRGPYMSKASDQMSCGGCYGFAAVSNYTFYLVYIKAYPTQCKSHDLAFHGIKDFYCRERNKSVDCNNSVAGLDRQFAQDPFTSDYSYNNKVFYLLPNVVLSACFSQFSEMLSILLVPYFTAYKFAKYLFAHVLFLHSKSVLVLPI